MMKRLPNILTFGRIVIIPVIVALFFWDSQMARWLAFLLFVLAAVTDFADGWIARRFQVASPL
ncbi:MAG: CDP-alcohol phosphatidyltransferase family protein, partial [Pseudomonadota bacterium]